MTEESRFLFQVFRLRLSSGRSRIVKPSDQTPASKRKYRIEIYKDWCKRCGICIEFCPTRVLEPDESGHPRVKNPDACIGCRQCEIRCPDFAIEVQDEE